MAHDAGKMFLKNAVFGSSERLPPLSGVPPTNKRTPPPISKTQPAAVIFFGMRASDCNQLSNELVQQLYQHCLIFPHPPRKNIFAMWQFQDAKIEKKNASPK